MLVLKRKRWEKIHIGDDVVIKVLHTSDGAVRLGIKAPDHVRVLRSELLDQVDESASSSGARAEHVSADAKDDAKDDGAGAQGLVDVADPEPQHPSTWDIAISDQFPQAV